MNKRIKELLKQAGFTVVRGQGLKETVPEDVFVANVCVSNEIEKFAQLIAKEYGNIVLHYANVDEGVAVANKHFGVEE